MGNKSNFHLDTTPVAHKRVLNVDRPIWFISLVNHYVLKKKYLKFYIVSQ